MASLLLAIDQGTTGTQVAFYDTDTLTSLARAKVEFRQIFPSPGLVEHAPSDIWTSLEQAYAQARKNLAMQHPGRARDVVSALGITNQRETCVAWDKRTGEAACNAIVWQDRRTADACAKLKADAALSSDVAARTGLVCDPYFSATKMQWMLASEPTVARLAGQGALALGTIDAWLIWKISGGVSLVTEGVPPGETIVSTAEGSMRIIDAPAASIAWILPIPAHSKPGGGERQRRMHRRKRRGGRAPPRLSLFPQDQAG